MIDELCTTYISPFASSATSFAAVKPVCEPVMSRMGATFPSLPAANSSSDGGVEPDTQPVPQFATYKLPARSIVMPTRWPSCVFDPAIVIEGHTFPQPTCGT